MDERPENKEESNNELFKGINYTLCEDVNDSVNIKKILKDKGGVPVNYLSDLTTHFIADNPDNPNVEQACEVFEKVSVTSQWVILSEQANVLLPLEPFYTDKKKKLFGELNFTASNLSKEDKSKLWAIITYYGGNFQLNLTDKSTHLITTSCKGKKYDKASKLINIKIVSPDWLFESIKNKKLVDENIYHPKYLITTEYLQMKKEKEERLKIEEERKRQEEEEQKKELERKQKEIEKRKIEEKEKIEEKIKEERRKIEERKRMEEEASKKQAAAAAAANKNLVQNKSSTNVNISSSSPNVQSSSMSTISSQQHQTATISTISVPTITTQQQLQNSNNNSINVPTTQLTLRTVSLPSTTFVSNIPQNAQHQQTTTTTAVVSSPSIKQGTAAGQKIKLVVPSNQITRMPNSQNLIPSSPNQNFQPQQLQQQSQQQQQIKTRILTPHSSPMTIQQSQVQNIQYTTTDTNLNNQQYQQTVNINQTGHIQQGHPQQITITQADQGIQQLRPGEQINTQPRQQQLYFAVQQPQQIRPGQQLNFIQIRQPAQFVPVQASNQLQQQQQIRQIQPNQINNNTSGNLNQQTAQIIQTQNQQLTISGANTVQNNQNKPLNSSANEIMPTTQVHKSTNIILQQRVQPPVQLQAQQSQQQQQQNIQPMIIQQQSTNQLNNNTLNQSNQPQQIQVLPGQQLIQIQRPVHGQINQQQIIRGQNPQQIIFQSTPNNIQQNGPRQQTTQLQTIPQPATIHWTALSFRQGAIFQQSPTQANQVQRVQQLRMTQNNNIQQSQQVRLATVSPMHPQQQNTQLNAQQTNISQSPQPNQKPQRFLIKSPPQYIQQGTPTSMLTIRTPIQQQQIPQQTHLQTSPMHQNQQTKIMTTTPPQQPQQPQLINQNKPQQMVNKFNPNQTSPIRQQQWASNDQQQQQQQIIRANGAQMMQLAPGHVILQHNQHTGQQMPQQATMILQQGPPQTHNIQTQQWTNQPNLNNQITQTMVQVRPQNVQIPQQQMMNIQQQQQQSQQGIRLIQQPTTPTQPVNHRLQTPPSNTAIKTTSALVSHQIPTITDPNVSNQVRIEQVNCIISSSATLLQNLNADSTINIVNNSSNASNNRPNSIGKSAIANMLKNKSKNNNRDSNLQSISASNSTISINKKDSSLNSNIKLDASNKFTDTLRSLDGYSPNSSNSSVTSLLVQNSTLEKEVIIDKYYNFDAKITVPNDICLIGCTFYIVEYESGLFKLDQNKKKSIENNIIKYGGQLVNEYNFKVTHLICESYSNQIVQRALKENKRCVTVFWLDDILEDKKMKYPFKPWHLPRKFDIASSPCKDKIISITNFNTNERNRIYEIISLAGGNYTSYMTQQNNLLVCKKFEGRKLKKAIEWGINVVNHLWLQDLWFGKLKEETDRRYTVCDNKDILELDYTLTKELMVGWKTSLKLNEQDHKRLNEFKESMYSKNWKKPTDLNTVLTSKENIIDNNLKNATSLNLNKPKFDENNKNSNVISNQNSNLLNNISQFNSQQHITLINNTSSTSSTFVISNQTNTLTNNTFTVNLTSNDNTPILNTPTTTLSTIKIENLASNSTDQKALITVNELSIKKEKIDNESINKVPINDVQKTDESMEIDSTNNNEIKNNDNLNINETRSSDQQTEINNANLVNSSIDLQPTSQQSTIEIKPIQELNIDSKTDNLDNKQNNINSNIELVNDKNYQIATTSIEKSSNIETVICTTPLITTTANVEINSNLNEISGNEFNKLTTVNLVNGDHNSSNQNEKESINNVEMMEVDCINKKEDNLIQLNSIDSLNKSPKNKQDDEYLPLAKRIKTEIENNSSEKTDNNEIKLDSIDCSTDQQLIIQKNGNLNNLINNNINELIINNTKSKDQFIDERKRSKRSPESIKVFFTNTESIKDDLFNIVLSLGGKLANNFQECTHLITSKVERTAKFICTFNYAHFILEPNWLIKSKEVGYFLKENDYFLNDKLNEDHFGFTIKESFERRNKRNRPLFENMLFFITKSCIPSFKLLIQFIRAGGGRAVVKEIPSASQIDALKNSDTRLVVISCDKDLHICDIFFEKNIPVLCPEFVLSNILKQTIEYEPYLLDYN